MLAGKTDNKNGNNMKELEAAQSSIVQLKEELNTAISQRDQMENNLQQNQQQQVFNYYILYDYLSYFSYHYI